MSGLPKGIAAAIATPFVDGAQVDHARLLHHARWLLANGCNALVLFGTTGEAASLTIAERKEILESLLGAGIEPGRIVVGTGCCAVEDTVDLSRHATARAVAGVLLIPPFFFKGVDNAGVIAFYREVIERIADLAPQVCLYNIPAVSGVTVGVDIVRALKEAFGDLIAGYKDSSGDWDNTQSILAAFPGIDVFVGSEATLLANLRLGGAGCISATANVQPSNLGALYSNWQTPHADALQAQATRVRQRIQGDALIPAVKHLVSRIHEDPQWRRPRAPLVALVDAKGESLWLDIRDAIRGSGSIQS